MSNQPLETVIQARVDFERRSERLLHLFTFVPDDKLTWTPSPTAKSALRIVAHCGLTSRFFADAINGKQPEVQPSVADFFKNLAEAEQKITTREQAIDLVKETTAELVAALATINTENINGTANSPFGELPMSFWIGQGSEQMTQHAGQLEYLQTIWGDLDNHLG